MSDPTDRERERAAASAIEEMLYRLRRKRDRHADCDDRAVIGDAVSALRSYTHHCEIWTLAWAALIALPRRDQCDMFDSLYEMLSPVVPSPALWSLDDDSRVWAEGQPHHVRLAFALAILASMTEDQQARAMKAISDTLEPTMLKRTHEYQRRLVDRLSANIPESSA